MFEHLRCSARLWGLLGQTFGDQKLLAFEQAHALLQLFTDRRIVDLNDPVEQPLDVLVDLRRLGLEDRFLFVHTFNTHLPEIIKHGAGQRHELRRWLKLAQPLFEITLQRLAPDRLAVVGAASGLAQIVGMFLAGLAGRPAGGHGLRTGIAAHKAPEREVLIDVLAHRGAGRFLQALLNAFKTGKRDQPVMTAIPQADIPVLRLHEPRIGRIGEDIGDALIADRAVGQVFRIFRLGFEEPLHLDLGLEAA